MLILLMDYILDDESTYTCQKQVEVPTKFVPAKGNLNNAILSPITICNQNLLSKYIKEEFIDWEGKTWPKTL